MSISVPGRPSRLQGASSPPFPLPPAPTSIWSHGREHRGYFGPLLPVSQISSLSRTPVDTFEIVRVVSDPRVSQNAEQERENLARDLQARLGEAAERLSKYDGLPESEKIRRRMLGLEVRGAGQCLRARREGRAGPVE